MSKKDIPYQGDAPDEEFYPDVPKPRVGHDKSMQDDKDNGGKDDDKK